MNLSLKKRKAFMYQLNVNGKILYTLFFTILLGACSNIEISENDINKKAENWIAQGQTIKLGKSSFLPSLIPNAALFSISKERVKLALNATLEMRTFLGNKLMATGVVTMSGVPYLDNQSGKIYIQQYDIENIEMTTTSGKTWSIEGAKFKGAKQSIANYVEKMPVYDITQDKKLSSVILSQVKTIELRSGGIVLVM